MNTANIENIYELSPVQQGILFHNLYESESGAYFVQLSYGLRGMLNIAAFERAWERVVAHHSPLRTSFHWEGLDKPLQVVHKQVQLPLEQLDWRGINPDEQQEKFQAFLLSDRQQGFNLSNESLLRLTLICLDDQHYHFIWSSHHIILDGWSGALVFKDFVLLYEALCRGEEITLQSSDRFAGYIAWLQQQDLSQAEVFWRQTLQGVTAPTPLTNLEVHSLSAQAEKYLEQRLKLSPATTTALKSWAKQHQLTLNTIVQGAWALLLSRYSGEDEVVYGVTVSGRPVDLPTAESMVGIFINTLPLRVKLDGEMLLLPWLEQLQRQLLEIRQYEYSPLVEIQGWSEIPRGLPLFESIVVFENYPVDRALSDWQKNLEIETLSALDHTNYPLTISVIPGSELEIRIASDRTRFDTATITRMLGHFQTLLEGMAANPEVRLYELPLLTAAEKHQLLVEWNKTQTDYPQNQCLHQLFEAQVEKTPDAVAVVFAEQSLTYQQLNQRANQLARYLQLLGVSAEVPVCICADRSIEMVVGLLGILKAGGAYVPLDPTYPLERLEYIQQDVRSPVLLTQSQLTAHLSSQSAQVVCLDTDWEEIKQQTPENLTTATKPNNLAYVIYTSGSTGQPKGVEIAHSNVVNFLSAMQQSVELNQQDVLVAVTTLAFDIAALEIFLPLTIGARVVVASREVARDGVQLSSLLTNSQATVMQATPATWRILLSAGWQGSKHLKILCGGEALSRQLANQLLPQCHQMWNLYGPTETTIWSTVEQVQWGEDTVTIGRPISNTYIYILDNNLQPTPIGVPGELHIGGTGVARGYWQRPELTAQKFITHPSQPDQKLYKTGDLVCYRSDGKIEYIGRLDYQVKIRGFRIELAEIEAVLAKHSDVQQAVVIAKQDSLIAYAVLRSGQTTTIGELRDFLKQKLPYYVVPQTFVLLDSLPLTPNGKVNRKALADADTAIANFNDAFVPPHNAIEEVLAGIWAKILLVERVGIHDNFFDLGGHSLLATQVISRIRETFKLDLPLRSLFESPTVAELSPRLIAHETKPGMTAKIAQILKQLEGMSAEEAKQALENRKANKQVRA
ncbi:amino acid adenylation domain-containing protein [Nostoc sp. UCD121]|uniref:non-ribosomal peptide synthetase n=1 Tax=unclassified Nostoc TaxID=2593658 RepID=UPI00162A1465|nr:MULTISPECIES: non-ribosomal peptide synthetase [unclassified Nostoc]MBC1218684.1 amino acid adenylation domain-containing protein [Nostoc sp. UCD120]MBC1274871.1 amino acid adenylation domain-containing protein [Nostoc sp. UCD121]MBC1293581.1 amino acid adenylation domain-containing protein [Nostoc sp. UCD122]